MPEPSPEAKKRLTRIRNSNVPWHEYPHLLCPISGEPIEDPVWIEGQSASHVFNRQHILRWFRVGRTNPLTNMHCDQVLVDAVDIREKVDRLLDEDEIGDEGLPGTEKGKKGGKK